MATLAFAQTEARNLLREHGLDVAGWTFKFDNAVRRGGACHYKTKHISVSRKLVPMWSEEEVRDTILHEVAHAMAGHAAGHGPQWRRIATSIGCTGDRTHSNVTVTKPYAQVCPNHGIIGTAHRRRDLACGRCYKLTGRYTTLTYIRNPELDAVGAVR